jgi:glycine cleavage system H protein
VSVPSDCRFLETHEWHRRDGKVVTVGITQFAADELTDVTYVELPEVGTAVKAGERFGEIESVKATADLKVGVTGKVIEVNTRLADEPELVNNDPFGDGWMIKVEASNPSEFDKLLTADTYEKQISSA